MRSLKKCVLPARDFCYLEGKQKTCGYINRGVEHKFTEMHSLTV